MYGNCILSSLFMISIIHRFYVLPTIPILNPIVFETRDKLSKETYYVIFIKCN